MIRTTNLLERLFVEERRRMKIIANTFGERPVQKLMYAAIIRASEGWRGIGMSEERDEAHRGHPTMLDSWDGYGLAPDTTEGRLARSALWPGRS
jgi:hypothetical protein